MPPAAAVPRPVVSVPKDATVMDAVRAMVNRNVGAVVVLDGVQLLGVFTERDVVIRVVLEGLATETTPVAEVMTKSVVTVREDADRSSVLKLMADHHIRHLPVVDADGRVKTMLSMRHLLRAEVQDLKQTVWSLVAENSADGPGG
ncbi:CBS domain-containing protein [Pendulispora albinea]|uniref:CBS domain-containing protein n=1 Tax=Pendulispora albinea TaxID=2741071 RepID=A0ABZ2LUX8_9BACT